MCRPLFTRAHSSRGHNTEAMMHSSYSSGPELWLRQKFWQKSRLLMLADAFLVANRAPPIPAQKRQNAFRRDIPPAKSFDNSSIWLLITGSLLNVNNRGSYPKSVISVRRAAVGARSSDRSQR